MNGKTLDLITLKQCVLRLKKETDYRYFMVLFIRTQSRQKKFTQGI